MGYNYTLIDSSIQLGTEHLSGWRLRFLEGDGFREAEEVFAGADICEAQFCN